MTIHDTLLNRDRQRRLDNRKATLDVILLIVTAALGVAIMWIVFAVMG